MSRPASVGVMTVTVTVPYTALEECVTQENCLFLGFPPSPLPPPSPAPRLRDVEVKEGVQGRRGYHDPRD